MGFLVQSVRTEELPAAADDLPPATRHPSTGASCRIGVTDGRLPKISMVGPPVLWAVGGEVVEYTVRPHLPTAR